LKVELILSKRGTDQIEFIVPIFTRGGRPNNSAVM